MPYRDEFFSNFYLRCTPRSALNDPFELRPSNKYMFDHRLDIHAQLEMTPETEVSEELFDFNCGFLKRAFKKMGISSFSETYDNLLMWSHYADNHRGIVVAFDTTHDFFKEDGSKSRQLGRVHYRKDRMKAIPQKLQNGFHMADNTRIYFEKSDEWIYEKEHRLLNDLYQADATLCTPEYYDKQLRHKYPGYQPEAVSDKLVSITDIGDKYYDASDPDVICMLQVPPECILSVICGTNMPDEQKEIVRLHAQFLGYSYYEAVPDSDEYKLNFVQPE
ncbi:MAG: hypothetical protein CMH99_03775 [Oceanospirillaceae bacterium]|nr:hypothetical protein [Oceanospirillaceae bacterium]|tara:strand:- start:1449 stop:2276 length:828 start_codon:yes stop_codon:yes gene_type:complete